jgi:hypothetical protein
MPHFGQGTDPTHQRPQVARWTLKNDGIVFRDEDWARLKKIGAFSVSRPRASPHARTDILFFAHV